MMESRELKFRAWDVGDKEWRTDLNFYIDSNNVKVVFISGVASNGLEIMQFTGLKDKNGKEIYEGDILRYNYHIQYEKEWKGSRENKDFIGVVEYHNKILKIGYESDETLFVGFILCGCKGTDEEYFTPIPQLEDIEVIGNIYENKELLEKEDE